MYEQILEYNREYIRTQKAYRSYKDEIVQAVQLLNTERIITVRGLKHTGKTAFISELLKKTDRFDSALYYNGSLDTMGTVRNQEDMITLFDVSVRIYGIPKVIILQDINHINDIKEFILHLYKTKKYKILIVGNNIKIQGVKNIELYPLFPTPTTIDKRSYGWIPQVQIVPDTTYKDFVLEALKNDIINTEILQPYNIKNISLLYYTLSFLSKNNTYMSQREMHRQLQYHHIDISPMTLTEYLTACQNVGLISKCFRYDVKNKKTISSKVKYYFWDVGIRKSCNPETQDIDKNILYLLLLHAGYSVYGWVNGRFEFAFYAVKNSWEKIAIAYEASDDKNEVRKTCRKLAKLWKDITWYCIVPDTSILHMRKYDESGIKIIELQELYSSI